VTLFGFGRRLTVNRAPKERRGCSNGAESGSVNGDEVREGGGAAALNGELR